MVSRFTQILEKWYLANKRDLPWRKTKDPYKIWISEIILQQTRIAQGLDYWKRFIDRFPNVQSLATASEDEVLKMWEGLGYYSRARNLHEAAKAIVRQGDFPKTYEGVRALKGIGDYTAAAICSFAYNLPFPALDGNAFRVLTRVFSVQEPIDKANGRNYIRLLAEQLQDKDMPGLFNQAMMDFGALQCVPQNPGCNVCPFADMCGAHAEKKENEYPVKSQKIKVTERRLIYVFVEWRNRLLLHKREGKDIWRGLYEPLLLDKEFHLPEGLATLEDKRTKLLATGVKHVLTHRIILADFYELKLPDNLEEKNIKMPENYFFAKPEEIKELALPVLIERIRRKYLTC